MKKSVKEHFDGLSSTYRNNFSKEKSGKTHEFITREDIVRQEVLGATGQLLDCASGTGEITLTALSAGAFKKAVVIDISHNMLGMAQEKIKNSLFGVVVEYKQLDAYKYEASSEKFDVILCLGLIAHTGDLKGLLLHLKSMLATDGKIILQSSLSSHWGVRVVRLFKKINFFKHEGYELEYYSISDIDKSAYSSNLRVINMKRYCFGVPYGDKFTKIGNYWVEVFTKKWSEKIGSEAVFVLTHNN
jgi:2-polyprenyl-3-methyl-5-hydroxy-6-metoxy-1,4-benzoquinol methylase